MKKTIFASKSRFVFALVFTLAGCATVPTGQRIDNIPMYGQPGIQRPEALKIADEDFVREASSAAGGRKAASKAWWGQAERFMSQGNLDFAMRRYNQSWLLDPDNYQPYWGFGRVMAERGRIDEAIGYLEKATVLCDDAYQKVALISDTGIAYATKASGLAPENQEERIRYFGLADKSFIESTSLDPRYGGAWLRWSYSLYLEGKYADAWEKLKKARSLGAKNDKFERDLEQKMPEPK